MLKQSSIFLSMALAAGLWCRQATAGTTSALGQTCRTPCRIRSYPDNEDENYHWCQLKRPIRVYDTFNYWDLCSPVSADDPSENEGGAGGQGWFGKSIHGKVCTEACLRSTSGNEPYYDCMTDEGQFELCSPREIDAEGNGRQHAPKKAPPPAGGDGGAGGGGQPPSGGGGQKVEEAGEGGGKGRDQQVEEPRLTQEPPEATGVPGVNLQGAPGGEGEGEGEGGEAGGPCSEGHSCGRCKSGFTVRHVKTGTYLLADSDSTLSATKEYPSDESGHWFYDIAQLGLFSMKFPNKRVAVRQPFIFEKQNEAILVDQDSSGILKTNFSFSHPGITDPDHKLNIIGTIVDRKFHFIKFGDNVKSAVFGLSYDPYVEKTIMMPIVHDSFYAACRIEDPEDCDCMTPGEEGSQGGEQKGEEAEETDEPMPVKPDEEGAGGSALGGMGAKKGGKGKAGKGMQKGAVDGMGRKRRRARRQAEGQEDGEAVQPPKAEGVDEPPDDPNEDGNGEEVIEDRQGGGEEGGEGEGGGKDKKTTTESMMDKMSGMKVECVVPGHVIEGGQGAEAEYERGVDSEVRGEGGEPAPPAKDRVMLMKEIRDRAALQEQKRKKRAVRDDGKKKFNIGRKIRLMRKKIRRRKKRQLKDIPIGAMPGKASNSPNSIQVQCPQTGRYTCCNPNVHHQFGRYCVTSTNCFCPGCVDFKDHTRKDGRCGPLNPIYDGSPARCGGATPCCSDSKGDGLCGAGEGFCNCKNCHDYGKNPEESQFEKFLRGYNLVIRAGQIKHGQKVIGAKGVYRPKKHKEIIWQVNGPILDNQDPNKKGSDTGRPRG